MLTGRGVLNTLEPLSGRPSKLGNSVSYSTNLREALMSTLFKLGLMAAAILCFNITPGIITDSHAAVKPFSKAVKPFSKAVKPFSK